LDLYDYILSRQPPAGSPRQPRIRWVAWYPDDTKESIRATAIEAAKTVGRARRVLVFGDGPLARELRDELARRRGAANVLWDPEIRDPDAGRRRAREVGADRAVGVTPMRRPKAAPPSEKRRETRLKPKSNDSAPPCPPGQRCAPDRSYGKGPGPPPPPQDKKVGGVSADIEIRPRDVTSAPQRK
jgi:hypothetical protein